MPITLTEITLPGRAGDPGFHLATYQAGQNNPGPAVVFCHGFPDLALGWQNQLPAVADAGYHAIAPDMRGYGGSSCPKEIDAYSMTAITGDLVGLLDALEIDKAIFVGHDWGGFMAWAMPVLHPDRVLGMVGACTPYMPFPSIQKHLDVVDGEVERQYVAWFQAPDIAEQYMDQHVAKIVSNTLRTSVPLRELVEASIIDGKINMNPFYDVDAASGLGELLLDKQSFDHYVKSFTTTGFRGGINWYRNGDRNAAEHPDVGVKPLDIPCLMLTAELDPGLRPQFAQDMPERCSNLEMHMIEACGHWMQQEHAETFNSYLISWLKQHFGPSG